VHGRYGRPGTGVVVVEGRRRGRVEVYRKVVQLRDREEDHAALGRLWARARIHRLQRQMLDGEDPAQVEAIVALALRHRLMTAWTSLVAVDSEIANRDGAAIPVAVPVEMPEDVSYEGVFGRSVVGARKSLPAPAATETALRLVRAVGGSPREAAPIAAADELRDRAVPAGPVPQPAPELEAPTDPDVALPGVPTPFLRITLHREDGTALELQQDGELWRLEGARRTRITTLDAAVMARIRRLLTLARARSWPGAGRGARLQVVADWGAVTLALPSADPGATALAAELQRLATAG